MKKLTLATIILFTCHFLIGQSIFIVDASSKAIITGTSTLHDWTSETQTIQGTFNFVPEVVGKKFPTQGSIVTEAKLVIPVTSLKSERGDAMNNKTHNAFKYETNPEITFTVKSDQVKDVSKDGKFKVSLTGELSMAGHTENITIELNGEKTATNQLKFNGSKTLNMKTYEMEPPSAMFGQIKTGEEVTIEFNLLLNSKG